ncbi:MAG: hypothetical protein AABX38_00685 [Candidatus Micrarchaeota archaeon]
MKVRHQSAATLILPKSGQERFMIFRYNDEYAIRVFAKNFAFKGGNAGGKKADGKRTSDFSPFDTLKREINEEMSATPIVEGVGGSISATIGATTVKADTQSYLKDRVYAPTDLIFSLRDAILESTMAYSDFLVTVEGASIGRTGSLTYLSSIFTSRIDSNLFDAVSEALAKGEEVSNEGHTLVRTVDELLKEERRGAWGYATILGHILDIGRRIPEYHFVNAIYLKDPAKPSYADYRKAGVEYEWTPDEGL